MPVTILDLVVIGIVLLSGLLAMVRGFTREVLAIASWAIAAVVAYFFYPQAAPYVVQYVAKQPPLLVNGVAFGGVFLATLMVSYIVTSKLSDFILDSRIGALDRTLGFLFGAARGSCWRSSALASSRGSWPRSSSPSGWRMRNFVLFSPRAGNA